MTIVAIYDYIDEGGTLLYQVVRYDPKHFRQRTPVPGRRSKFTWRLNGTRRVPYRLPETIVAVQEGRTIYVVEGEKDVDNLFDLGFTATCNVGGAGKWKPEYSEFFQRANVIVIPDADEPGRNHAEQVARSLSGIAASVKILPLPGLGKDVTDWIENGGTREELEILAVDAPIWSYTNETCAPSPAPHTHLKGNGSGAPIPEGQRNNTLLSLGGAMRRQGATKEAIAVALQAQNAQACDPPLEENEVERIANSIARYEAQPLAGVREPFRPTEGWNGIYFAYIWAGKLRYCGARGGWLFFHEGHWRRVVDGHMGYFAKAVVRKLYEAVLGESIETLRKDIASHAKRSDSSRAMEGMLKCALSEPEILTPSEAFDADPLVLNCANGTLDLKSGKLRPHSPDDLLTQIASAEFRGLDAPAPLWISTISDAFRDKPGLADFSRRAVGYSLTAKQSEEVFFFAYGPPAAGKTTFINAVADVMGSYWRAASIDTFLAMRREGAPRNDLAALVGSRFVEVSEPAEGQVFDENTIKDITGKNALTARFLFKETFNFHATCKMWFQGNHRPRIKDTTGAMWRRLLLLPFDNVVPKNERNNRLGDQLRSPEERAGILTWAVKGCLEWQRCGLRPPDCVSSAVEEYRKTEDRVGLFVAERFERGAGFKVAFGEAFSAYRNWSESRNEKPYGRKQFDDRLETLGFKKGTAHGGVVVWKGIRLKHRSIA